MKVAILHSHFLHWMGGTKLIYEVSRRLKKKWDVDVFVQKASEHVRERFNDVGIKLTDISNISSYSMKYWIFFPYYVRSNLKQLRKIAKDYDVFLATFFPMNWVATRLGKPSVFFCFEPFVWFHDPAAVESLPLSTRLLARSASFLYRNYDLEGTKKSEHVLTISNFTAMRIKEIYGVNAILAREGVDTDFFKKKYSQDLCNRYRGYKIILHATNYSYIKKTDFLLEALPKVKKVIPHVKLLIMSTLDNQRAKCKLIKRAKDLGVYENLEFLPFLEEHMLPYYYSLADVVVQPSLNEAASLPIKEAMACETPVIGSYGDGSEEDIGGDECGFRVHQGRVDELAFYIRKILKDEDLAKKMGKCGRERVLKLFSWDKVVDVVWRVITGANIK